VTIKGLLVGFSFALPYHVMRCAVDAGLSVHVLGNGPAGGLRHSRFCDGYHPAAFDHTSSDYVVAAEEIRSLVAREGFDVVFPSDDVSTRLLAAVKNVIGVRTSAIPSLSGFDLLNDKWNFYQLCVDHYVRVPSSRLYEDVDELYYELSAGLFPLPVTIKPTNRSGAVGVHHILSQRDMAILQGIDFGPVLAQRFIKGRDVGINVLCDRGKVVAYNIQERAGRSFRLFEDPDLLANVVRAVAAAGLHGPANIDAILEDDTGLGYLLECNPRFWYTIYMSMVLGQNFVEMSLNLEDRAHDAAQKPVGTSVRLNRALFSGLFAPWRHKRADWRMLGYHLADLIPYVCEKKSIYDDRHVAVDKKVMEAYPHLSASNGAKLHGDRLLVSEATAYPDSLGRPI
jgi:hypothetical protein